MSSDQQELFKAETTWFHVFNAMIQSGDLAKISGAAVKVYLAVKSHTNFATGRSFPSLETISKEAGLSESQVMRAIKELVGYGYLTKEKKGRRNVYRLRERVPVCDKEGRPEATASWDYMPLAVQEAVAEIRRFTATGEAGSIVHIENLTINISRENSQQINVNGADLSKLPPDLRKALESILGKRKLYTGHP